MTPTQSLQALLTAGWTETEIAEAVGVNQSTINRLKNGAVESRYSTVQAIAKLVGKKPPSQRGNRRRYRGAAVAGEAAEAVPAFLSAAGQGR